MAACVNLRAPILQAPVISSSGTTALSDVMRAISSQRDSQGSHASLSLQGEDREGEITSHSLLTLLLSST